VRNLSVQLKKKKKKKSFWDQVLGGFFEFIGTLFRVTGTLFFEGAEGWASFVRLLRVAEKRKSKLAASYNLVIDKGEAWQKFTIVTDDEKLSRLAKRASLGITRGLKAAQEELKRLRSKSRYRWW